MARTPKNSARPSSRRRPAPDPVAAARVARRQRRREHSREEILAAARRVLLRNGIGATTLDAVAAEVGVSKPALYYYFKSKDALLFELVFALFAAQSQRVHAAVDATRDGAAALRAIIAETVGLYAPRLDDFRLAYLQGQVAGAGAVHFDEDQFARIRPLNDLMFQGAAQRLAAPRGKGRGAGVPPRLLAFLAWLAAVGLLTVKGMVESVEDPLLYSDAQLVEGLARVFAAAAAA